MKGIRIFLADGFEETEALATLDVLRRGGLEALTVSIDDEDLVVAGSHGITVLADQNFNDFMDELVEEGTGSGDVMIFPGGMPGTKNLAAHGELMDIMKRHHSLGGTVAAICAAPGLVVSQLEGLEGVRFTCYDGFEEYLTALGAEYVKAPAVACGNIIPGRGPGCAIDFGLKILEHLRGLPAATTVRSSLMI